MFDIEYFNKLSDFLNSKDNIIYEVEDLTNEHEKFIFHIKYYIDNRSSDLIHVEFNSDYSKLKVYEFFEGKTKEFDPTEIPPWAWLSGNAHEKKYEEQKQEVKQKIKEIKSTKDLFN